MGKRGPKPTLIFPIEPVMGSVALQALPNERYAAVMRLLLLLSATDYAALSLDSVALRQFVRMTPRAWALHKDSILKLTVEVAEEMKEQVRIRIVRGAKIRAFMARARDSQRLKQIETGEPNHVPRRKRIREMPLELPKTRELKADKRRAALDTSSDILGRFTD